MIKVSAISIKKLRGGEFKKELPELYELKNVVERGILTGKGPKLTAQDLGVEGKGGDKVVKKRENGTELPAVSPDGVDLTSIQESLERLYIEEALKMAKGNESKAAKLLNINHHTFRYRRKKLQIK